MSATGQDYYDLLGVPRGANDQEIKKAFRRLARELHPDVSDHPDAEQVYRRCSAIDPRISISTVYRAIRRLAEAGVIDVHQFNDVRMRLDLPTPAHAHLIDQRSGRVVDLHSDELLALQTERARRVGYRPVSWRLEIYAVPLSEQPFDRQGIGLRGRRCKSGGSAATPA